MTKKTYVDMKIEEKGPKGKPEADNMKRRYIGHRAFRRGHYTFLTPDGNSRDL
jgi:hypothetical protein